MFSTFGLNSTSHRKSSDSLKYFSSVYFGFKKSRENTNDSHLPETPKEEIVEADDRIVYTLEDDEDGWSYKINSEENIIECYRNETIYAEMAYSYKNTDTGIILSVIESKTVDNGVMKSYEDYFKTYEDSFKIWIKSWLLDDFDYYEENVSSDIVSESDANQEDNIFEIFKDSITLASCLTSFDAPIFL